MSKVGEDCYFFIKASCRNGDNCTFRHCKDSILTQETCKEWVSGRCHTLLCPKRHPQLSTTPICKFENSPTGCLNRNCSFRHVKSREPMKLPTALAEVLKKSAPPPTQDVHYNGNQGTPNMHTNFKKHLNTPQQLPKPQTVTKKPSPVTSTQLITDPKPPSPPLHINNDNKPVLSTYKLKLKPTPSEMETPAPIPTITLRSESQHRPDTHCNTSLPLMSNLKVLTTHSDVGFYDKRINETLPVKKQTNSDPIKSPPSPITFQDKPKRSPITFSSDTKVTHHTAITTGMEIRNAVPVDNTKKRPRTLSRNNSNINGPTQTISSPLGELPVKRVKIRVRRNSSLLQVTPEEKGTNDTAMSPLLSPLDSGAFPSYSSDDFRIEDQIEDLINANFSPKHSQAEQAELDEMQEIQDTDDIFLEFENLIS